MKVDAYKKFPRLNPHELEKPISEVYEEINTKCNNFLRTQQGLQYLMLKYPKLSLEQAIREYYAHVWMCENYDGV